MGRRSYRAARREALAEPVEFDYEYVDDAGRDQVTTFRAHGEISPLLVSEWADAAGVEIDTVEGAALIARLLKSAFGTSEAGVAEYQRFSRLHVQYGDEDLLLEIIGGLMEDFAGRPTRQPSSSPTTHSTTGPTSRGVSSRPEQPQDGNVVMLEGGFRVATPEPTPAKDTERVSREVSWG